MTMRPALRPHRRSDAGFSLVEMIMVAAIAAAGAAVVMPLLRPMKPRLVLEEVTRDVADALRLARGSAIRTNRSMRVELNLDTRAVTDHTGTRIRPLPASVTVEAVVPAANASRAGIAEYRFYPDGSSSGGNIALRDGTTARRIVVDWLSGRVSTVEDPRAPR